MNINRDSLKDAIRTIVVGEFRPVNPVLVYSSTTGRFDIQSHLNPMNPDERVISGQLDTSEGGVSDYIGDATVDEVDELIDGMTDDDITADFLSDIDIPKVARIFDEADGYHICDDALDHLDARGPAHRTKADAIRAAVESGYTHATGSGTYWDGVRRITRDTAYAATDFARAGGRSRSESKVAASRENGRKGGRPTYKSAIEEILIAAGDMFSGNEPDETAAEWADEGFTPEQVQSWVDVGCWDALTAAALRDAKVTPERAAERAADLIDAAGGKIEAADVYTDGSPMYATCNGDLSLDEFVGDSEAE